MGTWGTKLYDNDCALDIKDAFRELTDSGMSPENAIVQIEDEFQDMLEDPMDGWIAKAVMADLMWKNGCLDEGRKAVVLEWLEKGGDLNEWENAPLRSANARKRNLERFREQLLSPMPNKKTSKKAPGIRRKQWHWEPEQVYALPLTSAKAIAMGLEKEYALFYILRESSVYDGYKNPKVWVKITKNGFLPCCADEFNKLEFQRISCTPYEERFSPFSGSENVPLEFMQIYMPDEWGLLPEYTMEIMQSTGNHPPENLCFLGKFGNVQPPAYEYFRYMSALGCAWRYAEDYILQSYSAHTLHHSLYYKK